MRKDSKETQSALEDARAGDPSALERLFVHNRGHLEQVIAVRWDKRLESRLDPSDAVQEVWVEAVRRLPRYLESPPMPFHLWLRLLARDTLRDLRRKHLGAAARDLRREAPLPPLQSSAELVRGLAGKGPNPSRALTDQECSERLAMALWELDPDEREIVLWRHFELLGNADVARLLGIGEGAATKRYIRTIERLRGILLRLGVSGTE